MKWKNEYQSKKKSLEEAASLINSGDMVILGPITGFPLEIVNEITNRKDLMDVRFLSGLVITIPNFLTDNSQGRFKYLSVYMGPIERMFLDGNKIEPFSIHFSQAFEASKRYNLNVAIIEVSQPNQQGFMCIGPGSSFMGKSVFTKADKIIVQVNPNVPFLQGADMYINVNEVDAICEVERPLFELPQIEEDPLQTIMAEIIAERIQDGDTLQIGFGKLANAIGERLTDKKDLGVHTEFLTPSFINLHKEGVVNGRRKNLHPEKMISAFCIGSADDYEYLNHNASIEFHPTSYVNNPEVIRKNDNFISVNNALAVDLTGQVSSESIGFNQYSGTGGQVDFVRGAKLSKGGKSFIALKSTTQVNGKTISRIPSALSLGTIVTTPRSDVQFIVTEHGIAELEYKSIPERVNQMLKIAHPDFREELAKDAVDSGIIKSQMLVL